MAREQIKDIVITLQKAVISHLHEVFMEEVDLDLRLLKETSDNSRTSAIVCLGQLYQRMSTAEGLREQIFRHHLDHSDSGSPSSVPRSDSQRTYSSGDGAQSTTSYTTHNSRPRIGRHRTSPSGPPPHAASTMPSETLQDKMRGAGSCTAGGNVMQGQERNGESKGPSVGGWISQKVDRPNGFAVDRIWPYIDAAAPPPIDLSAKVTGHKPRQESAHHADASVETRNIGRNQNLLFNPDHSTLEVVDTSAAQEYLPQVSSTSLQLRHPHVQQNGSQTSCSQARDPWQQLRGRGVPATSVFTADSHPSRVPTTSSIVRRLSIRSSHSGSSRAGGFSLRRALPPGIVDVVQKKSSAKAGVQHDRSPPLRVVRSDLELPSESNLAGFCKGAVRQQLGSRKKGFVLHHKQGDKGEKWFFRCTKCSFAGPATISTALPSGGRGAVKREKTFDTKIRISPGGIKYRWAFLAKSHVSNKSSKSDLSNVTDKYGCYLCLAEGATKAWLDNKQRSSLGTSGDARRTDSMAPMFIGLHAFITHLETHRLPDRFPSSTVAGELNCIVGRVASESEDFDLNLPHRQNEDIAELL
ncbi:hypothetical protein EDD36DRAFT_301682 [Exophiala viscosa]|uniref:Uncharacterized protein n=1 Tax=Exophiala viscosa TaxID=2486360 RepID=A0AAN6IBB8_9EURO|nr:hypothetical protein EDD36DRAFT_301682 [Exophiala viscosa]